MTEPLKDELLPWLKKENRAVQDMGVEPTGYRDLMWCPYLNEPAIIEGKDGKPNCPHCGGFEASTHPFMGHIWKPR